MKEYIHLIDQEAVYSMNDLKIDVKILDLKRVFGRVDVQITPVAGSGQTWVNIENLNKKENE